MPTYEITAPDGKTYDVTAPEGATQDQVLQYAQQNYKGQAAAPAPQPTGPQPGFIDKAVGSPIGRAIHDVGVRGIEGAAKMATDVIPLLSGAGPSIDWLTQQIEKPYEASLARNRNTPGYAKARAEADATQAYRGSGMTDQLTAPFNPALIGALGAPGGLDAMNANADAQAAAQEGYAKRHPVLSLGAGLAGGFLAGPRQAALPPLMAPKAPAIADLKAASKASYQAVDNAGIQVSTDAVNRLGDSLVDSFASRLDPTLHPDATAALKHISQYATEGAKGDRAATFQDLDNLRRIIGDAAQSTKPADKAMARMMRDRLDDFVGNLKSTDLDTTLQDQLRADLLSRTSEKGQIAKQIKTIEKEKPGALAARGAAGAKTRETYQGLHDKLPAAEEARLGAKTAFDEESSIINAGPQGVIDALNHARDMWSRASQAELIQRQIDKAGIKASANYSQSGYENALRQQFKSLALNDKAMARLTPEVQEAVKAVAKGDKVGNVMRAVGKYAPHGPVATGAGMGVGYMLGGVGGAAEGGLGSLLVPMIGEGARMGATAKTVSAANKARDVAALGRGVTIPAQPVLSKPKLPNNTPFPYLVPPLLMQPQRQ